MNIDRIISNIRNLREAAPTNNITGGDIGMYKKFLFPRDEDLLTQDYQTPAEIGDSRDDWLGVYPVMKLALDKSSDGPSIDSMVDASKEYVNKMNQEQTQRSPRSPLENIMDIVRGLNEDAPVNNVGSGHIAGAVPGEEPPVFMKKKKRPPILARGTMPGARKRWTPKKDGKY
tara:strand:- start:489 stop:1007 length:519 start_codon:yes stop_codon:yes gene_type:complete